MYAEYLRGEGFAVQEIGDTDGAWPLVGTADAVITGLMVPGSVDPLEFIGKVRAQWSALPIIVVTACVVDDRMAGAYRAGANVVLMKPCLPDTLRLALQTTIDTQDVRLVPPQPRRTFDERRADSRGGRRHGDASRDL